MSYVEVEEAEVYQGDEATEKARDFFVGPIQKVTKLIIYPKTRAVLAFGNVPIGVGEETVGWRILRRPKTQEGSPEAPRASMIPIPKVKDDAWGGAKVW